MSVRGYMTRRGHLTRRCDEVAAPQGSFVTKVRGSAP